MKKIYLIALFSLPAIGFSQGVGIGTTSPTATLDVVSKNSAAATDKVLKVQNTDGYFILTGLNSGDYGIGRTLLNPSAQFSVFGINNNGTASVPSFLVTYDTPPRQKWGFYINPVQGEFNPAYSGFMNWIFDNDGNKNQYFTQNNYGTFFGVHNGSNNNSGIFFAENGTTTFSTQWIDNQYLTAVKAAAFTQGSLRIQDEGNTNTIGGPCTNPGTLTFDASGNNFMGCAEIYNQDGTNSGVTVWKKLNNL